MSNLELKKQIIKQLEKALEYLEYSHQKILKLPDAPNELDPESLEVWESYSARFSRVSDIFLVKLIRFLVMEQDAGFRGSLRDYLNQAEKLGYIQDTETWMTIRSLRNLSAHEYSDTDLALFFKQLKQYSPQLLAIKDLLKKLCESSKK